MRISIAIVILLVGFWVSTHAVLIGFFPGIDALIQKADAIVVLRIDRHVTEFGSPTLYSTHDCYIYQTLKGDIPPGKIIPLQLMNTRSEFVTPYGVHSTHLMFLTRKRTAGEPTEYRTIEFRGANTLLSPFGQEKMPEGESVKEKIVALLKATLEYNERQREKEQAFLEQMINGSAENGPANGSQPIRSETNSTPSAAGSSR